MVSSNKSRAARRAATVLLAAAASLYGVGLHGVSAAAASPISNRQHESWCGQDCDQVVAQWNLVAYKTIHAQDGYSNPLTATRSLAMMHLAMHDAVNLVRPRFSGYASNPGDAAGDDADPTVAAIVAAHNVLAEMHPEQKNLLGSELAAALLAAGSGRQVEIGKSVGARAAVSILAKRAGDGHAGEERFQEGKRPGEYRFVPGTNFIDMPHWRKVTPFALRSPDQFRVAAPPDLASREYAQAWFEVKVAGGKSDAKRRTPDQTSYAAFWYEFSDVAWNRIARVVSRERKQDLWQRARVFALLNTVLADAYIAGWDSKMHYNLWRPVTAIRLADNDRNLWTAPDHGWEPLMPTPAIQDHPSTDSALGAAAARVLARGFGRDEIVFSFSSPTGLPGMSTRRFTSFTEAAWENADSRVRAGLQFRFSVEQGLTLGAKIGDYALTNLLAPVH